MVRKCTATPVEDHESGGKVYRKGNILVPDNVGERTNFATVLAAGPDCKNVTQSLLNETQNSGKKLFVVCPEYSNDMSGLGDDLFLVRDKALALAVVQ